jgi:alpha-mannosidase
MLANRGLPEYEVLSGEDAILSPPALSTAEGPKDGVTIALTLLRCVGHLARFDLTSRPGLAGPLVPTPDAQMPGRHVFDYGLILHEDGWEQAWAEAHRFAVPMRARRVDGGSGEPGAMPAEGALLVPEGPAFVVTALKRAEDGEGVIVRLYNITSEQASGRVRLPEPFQRAELVDMQEALLAEAPLEDGWVRLEARPNQIITIRFRI